MRTRLAPRRARPSFEGLQAHITAKAGNEGKLFGSIGTTDIAEAATAAGHKLARSEVRLPSWSAAHRGRSLVVAAPAHRRRRRPAVTIVAEEQG